MHLFLQGEDTRVGLGSGNFPPTVIYNGFILDFLGCTRVSYLLLGSGDSPLIDDL